MFLFLPAGVSFNGSLMAFNGEQNNTRNIWKKA